MLEDRDIRQLTHLRNENTLSSDMIHWTGTAQRHSPPSEITMKTYPRRLSWLAVACLFLILSLTGGCGGTGTPPATSNLDVPPGPLTFDFDGLPEGVPAGWKILFAPFDPGSQSPEIVKAQAQQDHFMIENQGTLSGLYALYTGDLPSSNLQVSLDVAPDGTSPMGVFLACRYSEAGWYQFRVSNGSSAIQLVTPTDGAYNVVQLAEGPGVFLDDGAHKLGATCDGKHLTLLADGREVLSKEADFLNGGSFGFGVESFDQPGGRKAFDNVEVKFLAADAAAEPSPTGQVAAVPTTPTVASPLGTASVSTATTVPTGIPTLRPTAIPADQPALYQTEFDDGDPTLADWKTFAYSMDKKAFVTEGYEAFAGNGVYRIRTSNPDQGANLRIFAIYDADLGSSDVDISTRGKAPYYEGSLGLVCRYSEAGWYQFMVEPNGVWSIRLVKPDETGQFHFHVISSGLKWLGQKADLRAECKGDRLTFYVDGEKMASVHDASFPAGRVGLLGWSFDIPGEIGLIDLFTVRRAQWNESGLPGPAATPGADGAIYSTDFAKLDDLNPYWEKADIGIQGIPGSPVLVGGPGHPSPHTYLYINDFDPGPDVEITADVRGELNFPRGLICRYSEDGWYETFFMKDAPQYRRVALVRAERDEQGKLDRVIIDTYYPPTPAAQINLTLTCAGNQISVKADGEQVLYTEDNTWRTGRYGFLFTDNPPGNFRSNTLLNYTVRPAQVIPAGTSVSEKIFTSPEEIAANWGVDLQKNPMVKVEENILTLNADDGIGLTSNNGRLENSEMTMDVEFLDSGVLYLQCRVESPAYVTFEVRSNGEWFLHRQDQVITRGSSPAIRPGKNVLTMRCEGERLTLTANGETIAEETYHAAYTPAKGRVVLWVNAQLRIRSMALKVLQGSPDPTTPPLLNQVSLPVYQPGETIFAWDMDALFYRRGWWGKENRSWNWNSLYSGKNPPKRETNQILIPSNKGTTVFTFRPDLYDLPVEISAEVTLASKGGGVGLFCHSTNGRYEFLLQPDGKWFIRRNTSSWYEPRAANITILANGVVENFSPQDAKISAVCNGSDLIFSLNGAELGRAQDNLYPDGQVGIFFDAFSEGSFTDLFILRAK
jgi:hypothetical protein